MASYSEPVVMLAIENALWWWINNVPEDVTIDNFYLTDQVGFYASVAQEGEQSHCKRPVWGFECLRWLQVLSRITSEKWFG